MVGTADPITPAGASQRIVDAYAKQYAAEKDAALKAYSANKIYTAPKNNLVMAWSKTAASYTKFDSAGAPITSTAAAPGTNHCNFTSAQLLFVAKTLVSAVNNGKLPSGGPLVSAARKANLSIDKNYRAPLLKFYGEQS